MLHNATDLKGFRLMATDGEAGTVKDFYFDAGKWTIRYLVVDTGGWLDSRLILISPLSILGADRQEKSFRTNLTRHQIEKSPDIDTDKPVSRQYETEYFDYYGYPYYWAGPQLWGASTLPVASGATADLPAAGSPQAHADPHRPAPTGDPMLNSFAEVAGYTIQATDDSFGHVEDFLIDDQDWSVRFIVVDTRSWLPSKDVMLSPSRIARVEWLDKVFVVDATRRDVESSPEYDSALLSDQSGLGDIYQSEPTRRTGDQTSQAGRSRMPER